MLNKKLYMLKNQLSSFVVCVHYIEVDFLLTKVVFENCVFIVYVHTHTLPYYLER